MIFVVLCVILLKRFWENLLCLYVFIMINFVFSFLVVFWIILVILFLFFGWIICFVLILWCFRCVKIFVFFGIFGKLDLIFSIVIWCGFFLRIVIVLLSVWVVECFLFYVISVCDVSWFVEYLFGIIRMGWLFCNEIIFGLMIWNLFVGRLEW